MPKGLHRALGAPSFRSFIAEGWDSTNLDRPFSDLVASSPGAPEPALSAVEMSRFWDLENYNPSLPLT